MERYKKTGLFLLAVAALFVLLACGQPLTARAAATEQPQAVSGATEEQAGATTARPSAQTAQPDAATGATQTADGTTGATQQADGREGGGEKEKDNLAVFLGIVNLALIATLTAPWWLRMLNKRFFHAKGPKLNKAMKALRAVHIPLAVTLLAVIPIHGILMEGYLHLHTGLLAWIEALAAAALGMLFALTKKRPLLTAHKIMVLVFIIGVAVHLIYPDLLYDLGLA